MPQPPTQLDMELAAVWDRLQEQDQEIRILSDMVKVLLGRVTQLEQENGKC